MKAVTNNKVFYLVFFSNSLETKIVCLVFREFRKKMDTAKLKITTIQKKQKDTERLASITGQNDKR